MSKNTKTGVYILGDDSFIFNYYEQLDAEQKMLFVKEFTDLVIVEGNYYKIVADMMFDFMVIRIFTDVDTSFVESENYIHKIASIEKLVSESNIVEIVKSNADYGVIEELRESCELNVEYKTGIHRNLLDTALSGLVELLEEAILSIDVDDIMQMGKIITSMQGELTPEKMIDAFAKTDIYKSNRANNMVSSTLGSPLYEA